MIVEWIFSKEKDQTNISYGLLIIFTTFAGGYIVGDFPKQFKKFFTTLFGQFLVFLAINLIIFKDSLNNNFSYVILESIISVILMQILKFFAFKYLN